MNILIIEDEIKTANEIKLMVQSLREDCKVVDILPSIKAAIKWFDANEPPDLILSDIQLADGLSFEIYNSIHVNAPIVFCTAFDRYTIPAFETNGIDYLLKPVEEEKLLQSLNKFDKLKRMFSAGHSQYEAKLAGLLKQLQPGYKSTLLVHFQDKIIPLKTDDIQFIYAVGGIVTAHTRQNKHLLSLTLDELEQQLSPRQFFKANRQFIIHRNAIDTVEYFFTRRLVVHLSCAVPEKIIVSKVKAPELLHWMEL